jgi:hypothetical protein
MADADLERKFRDLAHGVLPAERIGRVIDLCWNIDKLPNAGQLGEELARHSN